MPNVDCHKTQGTETYSSYSSEVETSYYLISFFVVFLYTDLRRYQWQSIVIRIGNQVTKSWPQLKPGDSPSSRKTITDLPKKLTVLSLHEDHDPSTPGLHDDF